jgi:hypothetical protein
MMYDGQIYRTKKMKDWIEVYDNINRRKSGLRNDDEFYQYYV